MLVPFIKLMFGWELSLQEIISGLQKLQYSRMWFLLLFQPLPHCVLLIFRYKYEYSIYSKFSENYEQILRKQNKRATRRRKKCFPLRGQGNLSNPLTAFWTSVKTLKQLQNSKKSFRYRLAEKKRPGTQKNQLKSSWKMQLNLTLYQ